MKWSDFVKTAQKYPVIEPEVLFGDDVSVRVQISRWVKAGKLIQLKRGYYVLAGQYRAIEPYEPYIASILKRPSYISLEKALEFHELIPERIVPYISVTTKRPNRYKSKLGVYEYRHVKESLFWGYASLTVRGQTGFIALPEKALLDYFYLTSANLNREYIEELRLQNTDVIDTGKFMEYAEKFNSPRISRAAALTVRYIENQRKEEKIL